MNFKNLTKVAAVAALLFASIPAFAVWVEKGPVYLHIQNDTDYDFNITQLREQNPQYAISTVKAHNSIDVSQLPWSFIEDQPRIRFYLATEDKNVKLDLYGGYNTGKAFRMLLYIRQGAEIAEDITDVITDDTSNEFHIFLTLSGNKENNFAGSSIILQAGVPKA